MRGSNSNDFTRRLLSTVLDVIVCWPGEHDRMRMDDAAGTDYLAALFSKRELGIDGIRERFADSSGSVRHESSRIRFSGSMINNQTVLGLLLAIEHRP